MITSLLFLFLFAGAINAVQTFTVKDDHGRPIELRDDRRPALYTKNFGDCQGDSLLNLTRFDAGYYKDNMTVAFHFEGNTAIQQDTVMGINHLPHVSLMI
jgi:hypothetical protein